MKQTITIIAAAAMLLWSCGGKRNADTGWSDSTPVKIMVIDNMDAATERNYVGDVSSEKDISLSFTFGGTITNVYVSNGQYVTKGQVIATIDSASAASLHATALASLRQAEDAYRRLEPVYKEGGLSEVRWMQMVTDLEKARQAELSSRRRVDDCTMRAPFSGTVSCSAHHVGEELRPGEVYCKVLDMNKLRVSFSVPEQEMTRIAIGGAAKAVVPSLDNRELKLRISDKSLIANPLGHTYRVHASVVEGDVKDLLPDMVTKVTVASEVKNDDSEERRVVMPSNCIHTMPQGQIVWVIENGAAKQRTVTVGDFVKRGVLITDGLTQGDTVITEGHQKMYTGAKVKVIE